MKMSMMKNWIQTVQALFGAALLVFGVEANAETNRVVTLPDQVKLDLVYVEPGSFTMGSSTNEVGHILNEISHTVNLTHGFWIGKYEVTQAQWSAVMGGNPSRKKGENLPVDQVSSVEALDFCKKLTEQEQVAGRLPEGYVFTLPTEAQWEYACRAGSTTSFYNGGDLEKSGEDEGINKKCTALDEIGWYSENAGKKSHPVGEKKPNAWGIYDMQGNVWEWCLDTCNYESRWRGAMTDAYVDGITDPLCTAKGSYRILRGGSWRTPAESCRVAFRSNFSPKKGYYSIGFRVVLSVKR